ncbi:hypothetical protein Vafri_20904 [Volvox africanus]|uniref:BPL/LPL catalytic domain-containing protein n=1 Tax=Volvox africanus TaxID=51714 RepID=A0A8J4FEF1_9CHLO|nr:hypothetical protein Vafri_20904 [Volvox africanus]
MLRPLRVINLASTLTHYTAGLRLQDSLVEERRQGLVDDTLILLQHYPVYTLGKRGSASDFRTPQKDLVKIGAEICSVPRGGELTFHGPGQLVAYPIIGVKQAGLARTGLRSTFKQICRISSTSCHVECPIRKSHQFGRSWRLRVKV